MALDARTIQEPLTPEARRDLLRAFADRMLVKITQMDDPEDLSGVERAVRTAAVIERLYNRCDRAEQQTPDPQKVRAERAQHEKDALYAQASLADLLKAGQKRRRRLGAWWDAAGEAIETPVAGSEAATTPPARPTKTADVAYIRDAETAQAAPERTPAKTSKFPLPPP